MICVKVDVSNPGQFFACCGLLELADRLWPGAMGRFVEGRFHISGEGIDARELACHLAKWELHNTMTVEEWTRLDLLGDRSNKSDAEIAEQKSLESRVREEPIVLGSPPIMRVDWWHDERGGGSRFKTWAGQQSVLDIARNMKAGMTQLAEAESWFGVRSSGAVPFYFDSDAGASSAVDVGFSPDPLRMIASFRPLVELAAFVGLQRFRPRVVGDNLYEYVAWGQELPPELAAVATSQAMPTPGMAYRFRLLFRTKYLKSFLPATARVVVR